MSRKISGLLVATLALTCVLGSSTRADAAFIGYLCDDAACAGGNDVIVTDQGAGDNANGATDTGVISMFKSNFAGFTVLVNTSQSKGQLGSAAAPQMDITFTATTADNASHTIFFYANDTGFTGVGPLKLELGGTQSGNSPNGNSVQGLAWGGSVNTNTADPRGAGPLLTSTAISTVSPFAVSANSVFNPTVNPYALTIGVAITRTVAGTTTGDLNAAITPVPEPATMGLFGLGMIGASWYRRRKGNKTL